MTLSMLDEAASHENELDARPETVGSFESLDGAARAVSHLVELQYDPTDVGIAPKGFELIDNDRLLPRAASGLRTGAITGAIVVGASLILRAVGFDELVGTVLPAVGLAAVFGALGGLVVAVVRHRREAAMRFGVRRRELMPTTFDVVVTHQPDRACHDLARWWDPKSRPASVSLRHEP